MDYEEHRSRSNPLPVAGGMRHIPETVKKNCVLRTGHIFFLRDKGNKGQKEQYKERN